VLQGEGVGRNKMPTRRIEVSGVTALVPAAQRLAYAMLQNARDCEDAVQEATFKGLRVEITEVPTHE
jgi:DNA-directed RNA polymerase specialized sigma24 family protein